MEKASILLLAFLSVGLAKICPTMNHTICNTGFSPPSYHECCCMIGIEERPPPEKSCNYFLEIQEDKYDAIAITFDLSDGHDDHLEEFPEIKFREEVAQVLHIDPELIIVLRIRCLDEEKKFVVQFVVLKRELKRPSDDKKPSKIEKKKDSGSADADEKSKSDRKKQTKKNRNDDDDKSDDGDEDDDEDKKKETVEEEDDENDEDEDDSRKRSDDKSSKKDEDEDEDEDSDGKDDKDKSEDRDGDRKKDEEEEDSDDEYDLAGNKRKYKKKDFRDASEIASRLAAYESTLDGKIEDLKIDKIEFVTQLYNIEPYQNNNLLIFQAAFVIALCTLFCALGVWRAIAKHKDENQYESVEQKA